MLGQSIELSFEPGPVNKSDNDMNSFLGLSIFCATFERDSGNRRVTFYGIDKLIEANSKRNGRRQHKYDLLSRLPGSDAPYPIGHQQLNGARHPIHFLCIQEENNPAQLSGNCLRPVCTALRDLTFPVRMSV
jgi:hypothetical protein